MTGCSTIPADPFAAVHLGPLLARPTVPRTDSTGASYRIRGIPPAAGLIAALAAGAIAAIALSHNWRLAWEPRIESPVPAGAVPKTSGPLPVRLVDLGAVGIPADTAGWGHDYSHNTKAFHRLILDSPPYVNEAEFRRLRTDLTTYVRRMAAYGNTGLVVPVFLELVSFGALPEIYAGTDLAIRHRVVRARFRELFGIARDAGMEIYLATDMAPLTPALDRYFERHGRLRANNPAVWQVYRAAFDEIFETLPEVRGVVVRVGEAGSLYNRADWPYRSRFLVGTDAGLQTMLRSLLPAFESAGRTLVLRSWSVGLGELGDLHTNPATYARALEPIDSPSLIVSTKFQAGDFFRPLTLNPTLLGGRHRRIVELQSRREFEGFSAFPNFLGPLHANALAAIRSANPHLAGTWLWTQTGGPLRAGPMSLYPLHGFWLWIDANVYVTSRLAADPQADPAELGREWVRRELTTDSDAVQAITQLLLRSSEVIDRGYYIRPFAQQRVSFAGFELPPLLWIMEWDLAGGWSTVWSSIYRVTRGDIAATVADGDSALAGLAHMRRLLERARPALSGRPGLFRQMERSLRYEQSLIRTLAWYRAAFLQYYRWLDTGDGAAYRQWRSAGAEFRGEAEVHRTTFGGDLNFPAFDFSAGLRSVHLARRATDSRWIARALLAMLLLPLVLGPRRVRRSARTIWWAALDPWHLQRRPLSRPALLLAVAVVLSLVTVAVSMLLSFTSAEATIALMVVLSAFLLVLELSLAGIRRTVGSEAFLVVALGPMLWVAAALLAAMSLRGPHHLWFEIWTSAPVRYAVLAVVIGLPLWTAVAVTVAARRLNGITRGAAIGSVALAAGSALLLLAVISPGIDQLLGALDRPLSLAPMTYAVVIGIETYTHFPLLGFWYPVALGALLAIGGMLRRYGGTAVTGTAVR